VLKLLRMFRGLYMTLNAFREAMGSMGYLGAVLITGLYVCSIFTTATIGHSEKLKHIQMGSVTAEDRFGTIPRSMYSLFELMTLEGWDLVGRPLVEVEPLFSIFLGMFIMVFTFGLLNMIVAFVVEKTMKQARLMGELNHHESLKEVAEGILQMKTIFEESDADGSGVISKREFQEALLNMKRFRNASRRLGSPHMMQKPCMQYWMLMVVVPLPLRSLLMAAQGFEAQAIQSGICWQCIPFSEVLLDRLTR